MSSSETDWRIRNIAEQAATLASSIEYLSAQTKNAPALSDLEVVLRMIEAARSAFVHLEDGRVADTAQVAWACRSLIELKIFSRYLAESADNRQRFVNDAIIDAEQSDKALQKLIGAVEHPASDLEQNHAEEMKRLSDELRLASGFEGKDFLQATAIAAQYGWKLELAIHKLCSKLVHPTAQFVLFREEHGADWRNALYVFGGKFLFDLMDDLVPLAESLVKI